MLILKKIKSTWKAHLCIALFLLYAKPGVGQIDISSTEDWIKNQYIIERVLNTENGLPANGVNSAIQDSRGFIWFATFNGLVRYDGNRVLVYNTNNISGLPTNRFTTVSEGPDGEIWGGLEHGGFVMIDKQRNEVYQIDDNLLGTSTFVNQIFVDDDRKVWVGTNFGLFIFENEEFRKIKGVPDEVLQQIHQEGDQIYLLFEYGLFKIDQDGSNPESVLEISDLEIIFNSDRTGEYLENFDRFWKADWKGNSIYVAHEHGVLEIQGNHFENILSNAEAGLSVLHGVKSDEEYFYIYGTDGLRRTSNIHTLENKEVITTNYRVLDLMFDHEGSVWASTTGHGVIQFSETPVYQGEQFDFLLSVPVTAVLEDRQGFLWTGTNCDGLYSLKNDTIHRYGISEGIENLCVWSVMEQSDGTIWAGTWGNGVFYLNENEDRFVRFIPDAFEDVTAVLSIFEDSAGIIWFGSFDRGVFRYDGNGVESVKNESDGYISATRMFFEMEDGNILFATDRGIGYYDNGRVIKPEEFKQLQTNNYRVIKSDSYGRIWFGSYGGGMFVLDNSGSMFKITDENGLFDNTVSQLEFDADDNLWLAGNQGVFFIEKEQINLFLDGDIDELRVARIGVDEGLRTRETTGGFMPSSYLNEEGELFIPTVQGMAMLQTGRMELNRKQPNIILDEVEINGIQYSPEEITEISYDSQRIFFRFTALSFKNPAYVKIQYKLEGFDANWQNADQSREAIYTSLPHGDYTLLLRAANNDSFWNEDNFTFSFVVPPPFWLTWWFYLLIFILIAGTSLLFIQYRTRKIKLYNERLQKLIGDRTSELKASNQELKKLVEEKNKMMSILAHDLRNPFTGILGYIELLKIDYEEKKDQGKLEMMTMLLDSGRNTLNLLENLLQWSGAKDGGLDPNPEIIDISELVREGIDMTEAQSAYKDVKVIYTNDQPYFAKADRNMMLSVVRNLMSNAIKFSGMNSKIFVDIDDNGDELIVSVKDEGMGIESKELELLFSLNGKPQKLGTKGEKGIGMGLQLCKEFIDKHDGKIWAESTPGKGSTFYFSLEKARHPFQEEQITEK